jgi:hypothetical protein
MSFVPPTLPYDLGPIGKSFYYHIAGLLNASTQFSQALVDAVRALTYVMFTVAPRTTLLINQRTNRGEELPSEANGWVAKLQAGQGKHIALQIQNFVYANTLSDDFTRFFMSGRQMTKDGMIVGHVHLTMVKESEYEQLQDYRSGMPGAAQPESYFFAGAGQGYDPQDISLELPSGEGVIWFTQGFTGNKAVEYGVLYRIEVELVGLDDLPIPHNGHGKRVGNLEFKAVFFQGA